MVSVPLPQVPWYPPLVNGFVSHQVYLLSRSWMEPSFVFTSHINPVPVWSNMAHSVASQESSLPSASYLIPPGSQGRDNQHPGRKRGLPVPGNQSLGNCHTVSSGPVSGHWKAEALAAMAHTSAQPTMQNSFFFISSSSFLRLWAGMIPCYYLYLITHLHFSTWSIYWECTDLKRYPKSLEDCDLTLNNYISSWFSNNLKHHTPTMNHHLFPTPN